MVGEEALESLMAARRQSILRQQQSFSGSADNLAAIGRSSRSTSAASSSKPTAEPAPAPEADAVAQAQTQMHKKKEVDLIHWGTDEKSSDLLNEPDIQRALMNFTSSSSSASPRLAVATAAYTPQTAAPAFPPPLHPPTRPPPPALPLPRGSSPAPPNQYLQGVISPSTTMPTAASQSESSLAPSPRPARPPPPRNLQPVREQQPAAPSPLTSRPSSLVGTQSRPPSDPKPPSPVRAPSPVAGFATLPPPTQAAPIPASTEAAAPSAIEERQLPVSSLISRFSSSQSPAGAASHSPPASRSGPSRAATFHVSPQPAVAAPRAFPAQVPFPVRPAAAATVAARAAEMVDGGAAATGDLLDFGPRRQLEASGVQPDWAEFDPLCGANGGLERKKVAPLGSDQRPFSAFAAPSQHQRTASPGVSSLVIPPAAIRTPLQYQQMHSGMAPQPMAGLAALSAAGGLRFPGQMRVVPWTPAMVQAGAPPNPAGFPPAFQRSPQPSSKAINPTQLDPFGD